MTPGSSFKVLAILGVVLVVGLTCSAETDSKNRSKYKYGYVISHKGGSTQAHLESRDGNLALGRYYVDLRNGTGQKVTYFADDLGFHTGVSYSSQNGRGSSKAHFAMGLKAVASFGNSDASQSQAVGASALAPQYVKKLIKTGATVKPGAYPKLNYTPVPGGFYLTHESIDSFNETAEDPSHAAGVTSQPFSPQNDYEGKYSNGVFQSKANTQTFYPTSEMAKNEINRLHIQSTTPSIKTYTLIPREGSPVSANTQFSQGERTVKVSSYVTDSDDLSYSSQKSVEKTDFADIDAQIISEVQKHAEQVILKDLAKARKGSGFGRFPPPAAVPRPDAVTMQPIVVTSDGETGVNSVRTTTAAPEGRKSNKDLQGSSINSVGITGKNNDQILEDSGYFGVSLSPSLDSSINVSQPPQQLIDAESSDRNSDSNDSNDSNACGSDACEKDSDQRLSIDLTKVKPKKDIDGATVETNKITQTFYPQNEQADERHYVTTIDVQKGISLEVQQNEDGSIRLAQNFPFDRVKPYKQVQNSLQYNLPTPQPLVSNPASVAPAVFVSGQNLNFLSAPQKPYILNTVTTAPGLFDVAPNQNLAVLQGYNDLASPQVQYGSGVQDRIETSPQLYENQVAAPATPVVPTDQEELRLKQEADLRRVQQNIQNLRQQILSDIDAQHEEEQRKQKLVDEERKQYFENLRKVEALKEQNSISYSLDVSPRSNAVQATPSPAVAAGGLNPIELVPQTQYVQQPQTSGYQTEIKDFADQIPPVQQTADYQKKVVSYVPQQVQVSGEGRQWSLYDSPSAENANAYADNNLQPSVPAYATEKVQLNNYVPQISPLALQPRFSVNQEAETEAKPQPVQQFVVQQPVVQPQQQQQQQQATLLEGQLNSVPVNLPPQVLPHENKASAAGKAVLVNNVLPFDYGRLFQVKPQIPLFSYQVPYQVPLQADPKLSLPAIYSLPQQLGLGLQVPQAYKFVPYPDVTPPSDKQYHSTLTQRANNKLRVQPLKPSRPDEDSQREAVQNLLSQPQFHQTYYYPGVAFNNRLQLRHIRKSQISNSDQVRSQSLVRRGKSLKNLRIEYGFKPPLRPSVEFTEEVKPSIYGPSVQPQ